VSGAAMSANTEGFFHAGSLALQDRADSRRIAGRIAELRRHDSFSADDLAQIAAAQMFFLATADADGRPDCSVKGGEPGFVQAIGPNLLSFPDYDGNGMFRSLGNISVNPAVGLLFVDFESGRKMRINGTAVLLRDGEDGGLRVEVAACDIFPNCPRYVPHMVVAARSVHNPRPGYTPPPPAWQAKPELKDFLPTRQRPATGALTHETL